MNILTIDGPSGSGKGTIGQKCAHHLGWHYLDSGAIYRALAFVVQNEGVDLKDTHAIVKLAKVMQFSCHVRANDSADIMVNGQSATAKLREETVADIASQLAVEPDIRAALFALQKMAYQPPGLVSDGRDMGTKVFPKAKYKVFLTASAQIRAQRRYEQLKLKGFNANLARLLESIQARDVRDVNRASSPLKAAKAAVIIDTSQMSIAQVVSQVLSLILLDEPCADRESKQP